MAAQAQTLPCDRSGAFLRRTILLGRGLRTEFLRGNPRSASKVSTSLPVFSRRSVPSRRFFICQAFHCPRDELRHLVNASARAQTYGRLQLNETQHLELQPASAGVDRAVEITSIPAPTKPTKATSANILRKLMSYSSQRKTKNKLSGDPMQYRPSPSRGHKTAGRPSSREEIAPKRRKRP
jgi:hypothetical protein